MLISGWRGIPVRQIKALTILSDHKREFICSPFVQLELMTKPIWNKNTDELNFYEEYFKTVNSWVDNFVQLNDEAMRLGGKYGLGAMDALHIAASYLTNVDEFITAERPTSPLSRVKEFTIISIH